MSPEGVVLGADSTSSLFIEPGGFHFFNHNQKLFQIGEGGTLGALTWGLGGMGTISHRYLLAKLADDLAAQPPATTAEVADRWAAMFWQEYSNSPALAPALQVCKTLAAKSPYDPKVHPPKGSARTKDEEKTFQNVKLQLVTGFCIAGYVMPDRTPDAYEIIFDPLQGLPHPVRIPMLNQRFWGAPNVIHRLIFGADASLRNLILTSGKWNGTPAELDGVIAKLKFDHVILPSEMPSTSCMRVFTAPSRR